MLKPLLSILILVTLLALGINLGFFDNFINSTPTKIEKAPKVSPKKYIPIPTNTPKNIVVYQEQNITKDSNLSNELKQLIQKASKHFQKMEDSEALLIYDEVIKKTKNSNDPKLLKFFADALFNKAMIHNIYPNNDPESAIEDYQAIIKKFSNSNNTALLRLYMRARLEQAKLFSKDELLSTYDELIKKFEKDKEHRFDKEVEEFLFAKSFALMGDNDEAAMEALDNIIAKYQAKGNKKLPQTVQYSILNNIELSIITNNDEDKYVDLANKYLSKDKGTAPLIEMLSIIKNAQDLNQKEAIDNWLKQHADYHFPDWDFTELSEWADKMENIEGKQRIKTYLDIFLKQKYNRPELENPEIQEQTNNTLNDVENNDIENSEEDSQIEDSTIYEADPYINDIPQDEGSNYYPSYPSEEQLYDNPYSYNQDKNDGVTHTYNEVTPY